VDPDVGAPRSDGLDRRLGDAYQRRFDLALDGALVALAREAGEAAAIVGEQQP